MGRRHSAQSDLRLGQSRIYTKRPFGIACRFFDGVCRDYSGNTCDGLKLVGSLEQAGKDLVVAAYAADRVGVAELHRPSRAGFRKMKCLPRHRRSWLNVVSSRKRQSGSGGTIWKRRDHPSDRRQPERCPCAQGGWASVGDDGFTIGLPPELYCEVPERPALQAVSTDPAL